MVDDVTFLLYLIATILIIVGLKRMQSLGWARVGNLLAAGGMGLAVIATLIVIAQQDNPGWAWVILGLLVGIAGGVITTRKVQTTEVPAMLSAFNGFGGAATALVALALFFGFVWARFDHFSEQREQHEQQAEWHEEQIEELATQIAEVREAGNVPDEYDLSMLANHRADAESHRARIRATVGTALGSDLSAFALALAVIFGAITFSGSLLSFGKLRRVMVRGRRLSDAIRVRHFRSIGLGVLTLAVLLAFLFALTFTGVFATSVSLILLGLLALIIGGLLVLPMRGSDMPVVVALLNAYSGLSVVFIGLALMMAIPILGKVLIIAGAIVTATGFVLTRLTSRALNRSLTHIVSGGMTSRGDKLELATEYEHFREAQPIDIALACRNAREVIVVPGFGMAASQAHHAVKDVYDTLSGIGVHVRFAIHPVAGRMPGHMNVLLAEADIPYDRMFAIDEINRDFVTTNVVLVIGANDIVNPGAKDDKNSPLFGMKTFNVHEAHRVYVVKRSLAPGYAGVRNPLFEHERTQMVFGDARQVMNELLKELSREEVLR